MKRHLKNQEAQPAKVEKPKEQQHCDQCGKICKSKEALKVHMYNLYQGITECVTCDKIFTLQNSLKRHMKTIHTQKFGAHFGTFVDKKSWKVNSQCNYCTKSFSTSYRLKYHVRAVYKLHLSGNMFENNVQDSLTSDEFNNVDINEDNSDHIDIPMEVEELVLLN